MYQKGFEPPPLGNLLAEFASKQSQRWARPPLGVRDPKPHPKKNRDWFTSKSSLTNFRHSQKKEASRTRILKS